MPIGIVDASLQNSGVVALFPQDRGVHTKIPPMSRAPPVERVRFRRYRARKVCTARPRNLPDCSRRRLGYRSKVRIALAAFALVVAAGELEAAGKVTLTVIQLIAEPKGHRGETIIVRGIRCVDPGPGGFICEAADGGQQLRLDASGLGGGTTGAIAEKLIVPCNGLAALTKAACTFDVTFVRPAQASRTA